MLRERSIRNPHNPQRRRSTEMPKRDSEPYFLTPHSSNSSHSLLIFLPGMDETGKELLYLETKDLQAGFDVRCLVIPPEYITDWETLTECTTALIRTALSQTSQTKIYLCGESFRGCLALKLMERIPHLIKRLILINSASSFHQVPWLNQSSWLLSWMPPLFYKLSPIVILPMISAILRVLLDDSYSQASRQLEQMLKPGRGALIASTYSCREHSVERSYRES
ncbi:MAG: alpha/beta hydrolase [Phormidesmis sp. CAN_BIN36]|nr:alpha/beta hydrolase [Phormidesmis sp. CAN_BIN36]